MFRFKHSSSLATELKRPIPLHDRSLTNQNDMSLFSQWYFPSLSGGGNEISSVIVVSSPFTSAQILLLATRDPLLAPENHARDPNGELARRLCSGSDRLQQRMLQLRSTEQARRLKTKGPSPSTVGRRARLERNSRTNWTTEKVQQVDKCCES